MQKDELLEILKQMGFSAEELSFCQYVHEEDGEPYQVFELSLDGKKYVLKKAKAYEAEIYDTFFKGKPSYVPCIFGRARYKEEQYLLMEHITGENLQKCSRKNLQLALDALIRMQREFWGMETGTGGYENSLEQRKNRREFLKDRELEAVYDRFLEHYTSVPKTLCHDDLLPFNVIASGERAVLIDWEYGGILPYPVSLARLIAHGREDPNGLFFMTEEDKNFALRYYYENLVQAMGISYEEYRCSLDYFLFYEYCEWVYVGHKYENIDSEYFRYYFPLAKAAAKRLCEMREEK